MSNPGLPPTPAQNVVELIHGQKVADPYRWLEDAGDPATAKWMEAQDAYTRAHLAKFDRRAELERRIAELSYIDSVSPPYHRGDRYFYSRSHSDKDKSVAYVKKGEDGPEEVLIDPNLLSDDGSVSLHGIFPSYSGRYVAYKLSENNADESTIYVRDLETGKDLSIDTIPGGRYAAPSWTPDDRGFYYVWLPTDPSIPVAERPGYAELRFHALGTEYGKDPLVFPASHDPTQFLSASVSRDGHWLVVTTQRGWLATDVYFRDLNAADPAASRPGKREDFTVLVAGKDAIYHVYPWEDRFYITTNEDAPRYRVMVADPRKSAQSGWKELVPETDAVLNFAQVVGGRLVLSYMRNIHSEIEVRDLKGRPIRQVALPGLGSASGMIGNPDEDDAYFYFSSFTTTPQIYRTSIATGATSLWEKVDFPVDTSGFVTEQVWVPSNDGTKVPMFIIRRQDVPLDGRRPTVLYGYGGFGVSLEPSFSANIVLWVERGGIYVVANLRGGGEFGEDWHRAGMGARKQNVFDDFTAAAKYLIANKYTDAEHLGIYGGSNGGLLVGSAMTSHPELYRAVVCAVPLLDMVRYHLFGSGKTWISEYGSPEKPDEFATLFSYSPYHRVKGDTAYPSLLMLSADSDDRVDPMHARKFVAAVQAASTSDRPVLLRVEKNAGHGGADYIKREIQQSADRLAFLMSELGLE